MLLDNAKHIKKCAPSDLKKCILVKDLTVQQRKDNKKRREEKGIQGVVDKKSKTSAEVKSPSVDSEKFDDTVYSPSQSQTILQPLQAVGGAYGDADKLANYFDETIMEGVLLDNSTPHHVQIRVESDSDRD